MAGFDDLIPDFLEQAMKSSEVTVAANLFLAEVAAVWKGFSPVGATGAYQDSVQVTKPFRDGHGQVGALDPAANIVEYGSEHNEEYGPRAKTEAYFAGGGGRGSVGHRRTKFERRRARKARAAAKSKKSK